MTRTEHRFTVDAKLLRELGERLVGRPHIALAELVKNSYDADARLVEIHFYPDRIAVLDDGHGMSIDDFLDKWMRVGTTNKERSRRSPALGRTMTGSKGVGRLAVQLLARQMTLTTVGLKDSSQSKSQDRRVRAAELQSQVTAEINWDKAIASGDLTKVRVPIDTTEPSRLFARDSRHGTCVELTQLSHRWDAEGFRRLAREIWSLQPPYRIDANDPSAFQIVFKTSFRDSYDEFDRQMRAILDIWDARITARLLDTEYEPTSNGGLSFMDLPDSLTSGGSERGDEGDPSGADWRDKVPARYLEVTIKFRNGRHRTVVWRVPHCEIDQLWYDIRVFDLIQRQPKGIRVGEAREYIRQFGGVGVYDSGFRLPYYGADQDWLDIERTHAARLSASRLVPDELRVERGLQDLPTNRRLFGHVDVSTTHEAGAEPAKAIPSNETLAIQVTRDRLVDNAALRRLRVMVRAGLDAYAMEKHRQGAAQARKKRAASQKPPSSTFREVRDAVHRARPALPTGTFQEIASAVDAAVEDAEILEEAGRQHAALLGALATAGMTSLAYEHEISKQVATIRGLTADLERVATELPSDVGEEVGRAVKEMRDWVVRARGIRELLFPLMDEETRTSQDRFRAKNVADRVSKQIRVLSRGVPIDTTAVPSRLRLPSGTFPAWASVFQNIYLNSFNALVGTSDPAVIVDGGGTEPDGWVRIQDNGAGVDLDDADRLWEPFERGTALPADLAALGLGGTGLGLTIVRMITDELGAQVAFTRPDLPNAAAVTISWKGAR